jgi:pilus assembly protein CpaC
MRRRALIRSALFLAVIATVGVVAVDRVSADELHNPDAQLVGGGRLARPLSLGQGKAQVYEFPRDIKSVMVGDAKIATAVILSRRRANIIGVATGGTTISFFDAQERQIAGFDVTVGAIPVGRDVTIIGTAIRRLIPNAYVDVESIGDGIILTGTVATPLDSQLAYDIASHFVAPGDAFTNGGGAGSSSGSGGSGSGGSASGGSGSASISIGSGLPSAQRLNAASASKVVNAIVVRGRDQVMLKVTVAEMDRTVIKQLGINLNSSVAFGSSVFNFNTANPFPVNGQLSNANPFNAMGVPVITPNSPAGITGTFKSVTANLQAMEQTGVIRTLAEPTLTAISGETAHFLAGGMFPYPTVSGCTVTPCPLSIQFQNFGVGLSFTPVVQSEGRISLHVSSEVSALDAQNSVTVEGTTVPGLSVRRADTTAEISTGGTLVMAGMIENQTKQTISGLPGMMEVPILGALFKSRDYINNQTELVFLVTPYIAHAVAQKDLSRPDDGFADASDPASVLLGRLNRIYGVGGTVDPPNTYRGKYGFILD